MKLWLNSKLLTILLGLSLGLLTGCDDTGNSLEGFVSDTFGRSSLAASSTNIQIVEGNTVVILLLLDKPLGRDADLDWSIAAPASEFQQLTGRVHLSKGATSASLQINSQNNAAREGTRSYSVSISGPLTLIANTLNLELIVIDDDSPPVLSIANSSVTEGTGATPSSMIFTVTASATSNTDIHVNYATLDGTAIAPSDYVSTSGTLTIPAGALSRTITVPVIADAIYEGHETFSMNLSAGNNYTVLGSTLSATGTILDDEAQPTLSISDVSVIEGTGSGTTTATFTITASGRSQAALSVDYASLLTGTATAGSDFTAVSGTATIAAGALTTTFTVNVIKDTLFEADETVPLQLSGGSGFDAGGSTLTATLTIQNDDVAPTLSVANVGTLEGNSGTKALSFVVTPSSASGLPITFSLATSDVSALAGSDYVAFSSSGTIAVGLTSGTFDVTVNGDALYENNETFNFAISGGSGYTATGSTLSAVGTITNDDTAPTISIANVSVTEGTGSGTTDAVFTVTAGVASGLPITVNYQTSDGTAVAGSDYTTTSGTATIAAGSISTSFTVPVLKDAVYEAAETFNVTLSAGSGYTVTGSTLTATGTILNDDLMITNFDFGTASDYFYDPKVVTVSGSTAILKTVNTTFNSTSTFNQGTHRGTFTDPTTGRLTLTRSTMGVELDSTWTPEWSSLIGYWKMNETSWNGTSNDVLDSSGNLLHGKAMLSATTATAGKFGGTGSFNGAETYIDIQKTQGSLARSETVATWIMARGPVTSTAAAIFAIGDGGNNNPAFVLTVRNLASTDYGCGGALTSGTATGTVTTGTLPINTWYHLACSATYENGILTHRLYVNGILKSTSTKTGRYYEAISTRIRIGVQKPNLSRGFNGYIDDLAYWSKALTGEQIQSIYLRQVQGYTNELSESWTPGWTSLLGYWKMDSNWNDSSGKNNHATPGTFPLYVSTAQIGSTAGTFGVANKAAALPDLSASLNGSTNFAIAFWINASGNGRILSDASTGLSLSRTGTDLTLAGSGLTASAITCTDCSVKNGWSHQLISVGGGNYNWYADGVVKATGTVTGTLAWSSTMNVGAQTATTNMLVGRLDDLALWSRALKLDEVLTIYNRQKQRFAGTYESPILDIGTTGVAWTNLAVQTPQPYGKELPGSPGNELSAVYSGVVNSGGTTGANSDLSTNLLALWHMNETTGTTIYDSSSNTNNLTINTAANVGKPGVLDTSVLMSRSPNTGLGGSTVNLGNQFTLSAWVNVNEISSQWHTVFANGGLSSASGIKVAINTWASNDGKVILETGNGSTNGTISTPVGAVLPGGWHHILVTVNRSTGAGQIFVDGKSLASTTNGLLTNFGINSILSLGKVPSNDAYMNGRIDEAAIWTRILSANEVLEVYRRGANRIKYQARTCADAACICRTISTSPVGSINDCSGNGSADDLLGNDPLQARWIGVDGSPATAFSELQNNISITAAGSPSGLVKLTGLNLDWASTFFGSSARPIDNRYFQYRVMMESEDTNSLCASANCMPEISSVVVGPTDRYYAGSPTITHASPLAFTQFETLTKADTPSCTKYQVSNDGGDNWKYWDGTNWVAATTPAMANLASDYVSTNNTTLHALPAGNFKFRALLTTNAALSQSCFLSGVNTTYKP